MNITLKIRNCKKAIFFVATLINLSPPSISLAFENFKSFKKIEGKNKINWTKIDKDIVNFNNSRVVNSEYKVKSTPFYKGLNLSEKDYLIALADKEINKEEIEIQSQKQSEVKNVLYAEGDVLVTFKGNILRADILIYDKNKKYITGKGNISFHIGNQVLKSEEIEYDFIAKKGKLLKVKGLLSTENLLDDLNPNLDYSDRKKDVILKQIKKRKVKYTPKGVKNWVFFTDELEIDDDIWKAEKAIFTNDLLELNQSKIVINSLKIITKNEELRFKSSVNYLILDEKLTIPFWFGDRTLTKSGESLVFKNRWNLGFDNVDKDGLFIGRKLNSVNLSDNFILDLEPQFLIQRTVQGYTKSFLKKGDSITADKVKRDTTFLDYFALNSQIKGNIKNWNLMIHKKLNSFDSEELLEASRIKADLRKEITFLNSKWDKSFYGVYRDRVWNGSIGEAEIYGGYGSKLEKQNTWEINGISKTEKFSIGLGNFTGEALNSKNLVTSLKGNLYYSLDQNLPIFVDIPSNKFIDNSFNFIYEPIKKGLSLNTNIKLFYSIYESGNHQEYIGFGAGPEFILGNFKKKYFDYTRISLFPFYKIKGGDSMFKFDQIDNQFTLDIAFDQQLFGPVLLKTTSTLNLDGDSKDYGHFINSKISLNWKKRSYEIGIFYQPRNESGGVNFTLFGFE